MLFGRVAYDKVITDATRKAQSSVYKLTKVAHLAELVIGQLRKADKNVK